jgi:hypothetical protein
MDDDPARRRKQGEVGHEEADAQDRMSAEQRGPRVPRLRVDRARPVDDAPRIGSDGGGRGRGSVDQQEKRDGNRDGERAVGHGDPRGGRRPSRLANEG